MLSILNLCTSKVWTRSSSCLDSNRSQTQRPRRRRVQLRARRWWMMTNPNRRATAAAAPLRLVAAVWSRWSILASMWSCWRFERTSWRETGTRCSNSQHTPTRSRHADGARQPTPLWLTLFICRCVLCDQSRARDRRIVLVVLSSCARCRLFPLAVQAHLCFLSRCNNILSLCLSMGACTARLSGAAEAEVSR